jgi:hypothetical protein
MTTSSSGWMPGVTIRRSPNFADGHVGKVKGVVLHVTGGTAGKEYPNAVSWLSNPQSKVSAHFVISQTGDITQLVSINDSAFANGLSWSPARGTWIDPEGFAVHPAWMGLVIPTNPNWYTISIEHAGQSHDVWSPAMFDANTRVLQWIRQQLGIVYRPHDSLIGHNEISPVNRPYCPGPNVNYERIAAAANSIPVTPNLLQKFVVVSPDNLNVRTGPGTEYPIVTSLPRGKEVWIDVQKPNGWYHLANVPQHSQSDIGFVAGWYLKMVTE